MEQLLWDLAINQAKIKDRQQGIKKQTSSVFFIGSKSSGKTSIILRFLDRDEPPKPTVALEYTFGRRANGQNIEKDVGHIWELGGGAWLSRLIDIPVNRDTIMNLTLFLVVDLSQPKTLFLTIEKLLSTARERILSVIDSMVSVSPDILQQLKKAAWERVGENHSDKALMDPFLTPLVILGSKYDLFQDFESEKRKVICKTLRFIAHIHGATLQFFSTKQEILVSKIRTLFNNHLFGTPASKSIQTDFNKAIMVPVGLDSIQLIGILYNDVRVACFGTSYCAINSEQEGFCGQISGSPPISDKDLGKIHAKSPFQLWKVAYSGYYPQEKVVDSLIMDDPGTDPMFKEHSIDFLRAQKDEELKQYRRQLKWKIKTIDYDELTM